LENAIVVPTVNLEALFARHAEGPDDSDSESDAGSDFEAEDGGDFHFGLDQQHLFFGTPSTSTPSSRRTALGDKRPSSDPPFPPPPSKKIHLATEEGNDETDSPPLTKHQRRRARSHLKRREEREALRVVNATNLKAVALKRLQETEPISVPFDLAQHTRPVCSTAWMGLRDTAIENAAERDRDDEFELPEARTYTKEEIMHPSMGMHYIDWDGCVCSLLQP
jgi:hypothetical protein